MDLKLHTFRQGKNTQTLTEITNVKQGV